MIGDQGDVLTRLKAFLPPWYGINVTPVLDGLMSGPAESLSFDYGLLQYAILQVNLLTATDFNLDFAARDFFGLAFQRRSGETDNSFRLRLLAEIFRPRVTRPAMVRALTDLTAQAPKIFEPGRIQDTGALGYPTFALGISGGYGSYQLPCQCFITVHRLKETGAPLFGGLNSGGAGYGLGLFGLVGIGQLQGVITDDEIYLTVAKTVAEGVTGWTNIVP